MRQFRTSTDSIFDIDWDDDSRAGTVVPQPGPPAAEGITAQDAARPDGPREA